MSNRPYRSVSNHALSNWYRAQQRVGRLRQNLANFNLTRNTNRNAANLHRAEAHLEHLTNRILGVQPHINIENRNYYRQINRIRAARRGAAAALVRETRHRIREARVYVVSMMSPRRLISREQSGGRVPSVVRYFSNFL